MAINLSSLQEASPQPSSQPAGLWARLERVTVLGAKVTLGQRMLFTERLALMVETGTPLFDSLAMIRRGVKNPALAEVIERLESHIDNGSSFAVALAHEPEVFDATYVNLIASGEKGGFLPQVLRQLYEADNKREELARTVKSALMYPAFLLLFSVAVVFFVLLVVFPKFSTLFSSLGNSLPLSTRVLMQLSEFVLAHWWALSVGCVAVFTATVVAARRASGRRRLDELKLRVPIVRGVVIRYYLLQTLMVMSLSLKNGVTVLDALRGCVAIVDNRVYQRFLQATADCVENGEGITAGFQRSDFIPDMVKQMIATGEETGNLSAVMGRIALHYESELNKHIATVSRMAEPMMLLFMGAFVGILVSSLILPIFQLSRGVH